MERIKREQNDNVQGYNTNKKRKLQDENNHPNKSILENLPNEIIYEIFKYLDAYNIYEGFFKLNKRFKKLLTDPDLRIQINISNTTKLDFERLYIRIILPHRRRIKNLRLSNPFTVDIVFSPPHLITEFSQLEILVLDHINEKSFDNISTHFMFLPKLHSLTINFAEYIQCPSIPFGRIIGSSKLKYCKITYREKDDFRPWSIYFSQHDRSRIEHLMINTRFPFKSFGDLLACLPRLRHLSINCLVQSTHMDFDMEEEEVRRIVLKHLESVSLKLESIPFDQLEDFIKNHFHRVEVLRLTTTYDPKYLDAKRWEQLITSSMPNLRIFDVNFHGYASKNQLTFHDLINQFNSSFWIEKQWFFTHQHDCQEDLTSGILYSTDPYRRKDYTFHWEFDGQICSQIQENFNSVKHVIIRSKNITNNFLKYFPNATELTIREYFKPTDVSVPKVLNRILSLNKLTKLVIRSDYSFAQIVKLIRFTPNLHTLKFKLLSLQQINSELIQQSQTFQYVSNTNKITDLDLRTDSTLEKTQLIVNLFPRLKYFKTGMKKEEIHQIVRFLLTKTNPATRHLFFLCIAEIPKRCLKELNLLIKSKNLLDDYYMKFVNRDLYLWW